MNNRIDEHNPTSYVLAVDDNKNILEDYAKIFAANASHTEDATLDALDQELFGEEPPLTNENQKQIYLDFAESGQKAFQQIQEAFEDNKRYAVACIDMRMPPGWDGVKTVRKLWSIDPDVEIIFCTAFSDYSLEEIRKSFGQSSNFLFVRKPFDVTELTQAVHALSEKWHLKQKTKRDFEHLKQQLLQSDKMACLGQLSAGVAHEINNPLSFVRSNVTSLARYQEQMFSLLDAYALLEDCLPENERESIAALKSEINFDFIRSDFVPIIEETQEGIERIATIVSDLRAFSRADTKEITEFDVNKEIDRTLNIVMNELKYRAEIVKKYGPLPKIEAVVSQLNQVILNLLVNAGHAIQEKGTITIETALFNQTQIQVKISDTGCGIPKKHLEKIFDPFFTTKPVGQGTGLGLSLSYGIIQKHHGTIIVESEEGKGTTFIITLPIKNQKE